MPVSTCSIAGSLRPAASAVSVQRVELRQRAKHRDDIVCQIVALRCRESGRPAQRAARPARVRGSPAPRPAGRRRSAGSRRRGAPARRDARQGRSRRPSPRRRRGRWDAGRGADASWRRSRRDRCRGSPLRVTLGSSTGTVTGDGHGRRSGRWWLSKQVGQKLHRLYMEFPPMEKPCAQRWLLSL